MKENAKIKSKGKYSKSNSSQSRSVSKGIFTENVFILLVIFLVSFLFLLLSLNRMRLENQDTSILVAYPISAKSRVVTSGGTFPLNDEKLDYTISVPSQWKGWIYKIGFVASPNDSGNSNQYLKIYLPAEKNLKTNNFDDRYKEVATIVEFKRRDYASMQNLCNNKGVEKSCAMLGDVIGENDDYIYVFSKTECPSNLKTRCDMADKIKTSFSLK